MQFTGLIHNNTKLQKKAGTNPCLAMKKNNKPLSVMEEIV